MDTFKNYLAGSDRTPDFTKLVTIFKALAESPTELRDNRFYINETAATGYLKAYHLVYGNIASQLLVLLAKGKVPAVKKGLWRNLLSFLYRRYRHEDIPGLLVVGYPNIVLYLDVAISVCHKDKVLLALFGETDEYDIDHEEIDELVEDIQQPKTLQDRINDLTQKRNEENRKHQERIRKIDFRMKDLQERKRIEDQKRIKFAHLKY